MVFPVSVPYCDVFIVNTSEFRDRGPTARRRTQTWRNHMRCQAHRPPPARVYRPSASRIFLPMSAGLFTTWTPAFDSASIFSAAVPCPPAMIAPA